MVGKIGRRKVLDSRQKEIIKELHEKGYSLREIAYGLSVSHETIRRALNEKLETKKNIEFDIDKLVNQVVTGRSEEERVINKISDEERKRHAEIVRKVAMDILPRKSAETAENGSRSFLDGVEVGRQSNIFGTAENGSKGQINGFESAKAKLEMPTRKISANPLERD